MSTLYVARSATLSEWAADVGLSKFIFKVGVTDEPIKAVVAAGWAGLTDWALVKQAPAEDLGEEAVIERLAAKLKMIDPNLYPRIKGARGLFKVLPTQVENHILVARALADEAQDAPIKVKPADFGAFLLHNARRPASFL